jgi:O-antigen/teichoic acid export membrane protein
VRRKVADSAKSMVVLLCGTFGGAVLAFGTHLFLATGMSVAEYGRLVAILAAINVLMGIALFGTGTFLLEVFGREGVLATRWMPPVIRLCALASCVAAALLVGYVLATVEGGGAGALVAAGLAIPILLGQSLAENTAVRLQLEDRYFALAGWQSLSQAGRALVVLGLFALGSLDIAGVLAGYAGVGALLMAVSLLSLYQVRLGRLHLAGHEVRRPPAPQAVPELPQVVRAAAPYSFIVLSYLVYAQGLVAMLAYLLGAEAAGVYNVALLVISAVYLLPGVFYMKFLAARLFRWWVHDREMFSSAFHLGVAAQLALGSVVALIVAGTAQLAIPAIFGARYAAAVPVLSILALGIPIRFVQHAYGAALFSREHIRRKARYMGCAAAASVVLGLTLMPAFGLAGAAFAAVLSELLLLGLYVYGVARHVAGVDVLASFRPSTLQSAFAYTMGRGTGAARSVGEGG